MPNVFAMPPGWSWDIVLYFFIGGLAGGLLFLACLLRLVGGVGSRPLSRIGFYLAFPLINVGALLLVKDLGRPERFWHMLIQSEGIPALSFKWWSPISFGSWILAAFGVFALVGFVYALVEGGHWRNDAAGRTTGSLVNPLGILGKVFLVLGAILGLATAGYTGMLLNVSNVVTWSHDPLLPAIFMASGVATAAAVIFLLAHVTGAGYAPDRHGVLRTGILALGFEAVLVAAAILIGIGSVSVFYLGWWAALFWLIVLPFGLLIPLVLLGFAEYRGRHLVPNALVIGAVLVLVGGILFRTLEVIGGQAYWQPY
jgi:formate-dependent nitrite reductase membrane component NrfD